MRQVDSEIGCVNTNLIRNITSQNDRTEHKNEVINKPKNDKSTLRLEKH